MIRLTPEQRNFVEWPRPAFVQACPGAGKTQAIAQRLLRLSAVMEPRQGLAVLSFSNSAVDEISSKCRELNAAAVLRHPSFIGTFDAFLRHFFIMPFGLSGVEVRPSVVDSWDAIPVEIRLTGAQAFADAVSLDSFDPVTNNIDPASIGHSGLRNHVIANRDAYMLAATRRRRGLRNGGLISAADARAEAISRLRVRAWSDALARSIAARFAELIVDEAQDCNPMDLRLLQWLRDSGLPVSVVADPDQAIYGFRHGNPADLEAFGNRYPPNDQLDLTGNFRSSPAICGLAATLRSRVEPDQPLGEFSQLVGGVHLLKYDGRRPPPSVHLYFNGLAEQAAIPAGDRIMLAHGRTTVRHACGLVAEDGAGDSRVSKVARAVGLFRSPASSGRVRESCLTMIEEDILRMMDKFPANSTIARCVEREDIDRRWLRRVALQIINAVPQICEDTDAAREAWILALREAITAAQIPCVGTSPARFYRTLRKPQWAQCLQQPENIEHTHWTTIHDAKGSQRDAVCVVIPPDRGANEYTTQLIESWENRAAFESKRVIYVGVTRARKLLALAVPRSVCDRIAAVLTQNNVPFDLHDLDVGDAIAAAG